MIGRPKPPIFLAVFYNRFLTALVVGVVAADIDQPGAAGTGLAAVVDTPVVVVEVAVGHIAVVVAAVVVPFSL